MQWSVAEIIQLVTSGGFGLLAWYLLVKWIPADRADFKTSLDAQQSSFLEALSKQQATFDTNLANEKEHFRDLLTHITREYNQELKRTLKAKSESNNE